MCPQQLGCAVTESCYHQRMTSEEGDVSFDSTLTASKEPARLQPSLGKRLGSCLDPYAGVPESRAWAVILIRRHQPEALPEQFTVSYLPLAY